MLSILTFATVIAAVSGQSAKESEIVAAEAATVAAIVEPLRELGVTMGADAQVLVEPLTGEVTDDACDVREYADRVRRESFEIVWPSEDGGQKAESVQAEIWTDAIQAALDEHKVVSVPEREEPYYLDRPLLMHSGNALLLGERTEMRMKPHSNFSMVRNEHLVDGQHGPVSLSDDSDHNILVSGGVWTTLATAWGMWNGNTLGRADHTNQFRSHGTLLFSNVRRLQIRNVTMRQCRPHAIQISNCSEFLVDGARFEEQRRDGVHINGPVSYGVIRNVRNAKGRMGDDMIALNGWDWKNTSMTFGPIHHVLVEQVDGASAHPVTKEDDTRAEIRLLPGTKRYDDGTTLACDIEHTVFRNVAGIRTFKMYDQPNLELGRNNDFADPIGNVRSVYFNGVAIEQPTGAPLFQIAVNGERLAMHGVRLGFEPGDFVLAQVGPMSQTYKHNPKYPKTWVELFSPDKDCVVSDLQVFDVSARTVRDGSVSETAVDGNALVKAIHQTVNPDYPNTTPRGGTGKGILR